jgi:hypothetical protein
MLHNSLDILQRIKFPIFLWQNSNVLIILINTLC